MKKKVYQVTQTGKNCSENEIVTIVCYLGDNRVMVPVRLTPQNIAQLTMIGALEEVTEDVEDTIIQPNAIISHMANRINFPEDLVLMTLSTMKMMGKRLLYMAVMREAAYIMDAEYDNHIKNAEEAFAMSLINGKVFKAVPARDYKFISLFRKEGDARKAYNTAIAFENALDSMVKDTYDATVSSIKQALERELGGNQ